MSRKVKNKKISVELGFIILILTFILFVCFIHSLKGNIFNIEKKQIYAEVIVGEKTGFDLNITALTFGKVAPGNGASRDIFLENNFDKSVRVEIHSKGEISDFLIVSENDFILKPREQKTLSFSVFIPKDSELKKYSGIIEVRSKNV